MFGQIFQFAAVLTDENFRIIEEFEIRSRRMPHIVPSPGALLVTGVSPLVLDQAEFSTTNFPRELGTSFCHGLQQLFAAITP